MLLEKTGLSLRGNATGKGYNSMLGGAGPGNMCRGPHPEAWAADPRNSDSIPQRKTGAPAGVTVPMGNTGRWLGTYMAGTWGWGGLLASSGWWPEVLLSTHSARDGPDVSRAEGQFPEQGPRAGRQESQTTSWPQRVRFTLKYILKIISKHVISWPHFFEIPIPGMGLGPGCCIF